MTSQQSATTIRRTWPTAIGKSSATKTKGAIMERLLPADQYCAFHASPIGMIRVTNPPIAIGRNSEFLESGFLNSRRAEAAIPKKTTKNQSNRIGNQSKKGRLNDCLQRPRGCRK